MSFFPSPTSIIGMDKEGSKLKVCQLHFQKNKWQIKTLETIDLETKEENVKPLDIIDRSPLLSKEAFITTAISSRKVLIRQLDLPLKQEKDIKAALNYQAEPLLPYSIQDCILESMVHTKHSLGTQLTLFALKKDHLKKHLNKWEAWGVFPEKVTCVPFCLAELIPLFTEKKASCFLLYVAEENATCICIENGKLVSSRFCASGKKDIESENFHIQINKALLSLETQFKDKHFNELFVIGLEKEFIDSLERATEKKVFIPTPYEISSEELAKYAIAIGAGLAATRSSIDFRQKEFSYPNKWKRFKRPLLTYFSLCLMLGTTLFLIGKIHMGQKLKGLQQKYLNLLAIEGKTYAHFEIPFHKGQDVPPASSLSTQEIDKRITSLETQIRARPNTFPLLPKTPKVSDLLAFLETHPLIATDPKEITIDFLRYQMVKRPTLTKKNEKYQAKVELQFTASSPSVARSFHEALRLPNPFVDQNYDVGWNASARKYRATFFLKDETLYR